MFGNNKLPTNMRFPPPPPFFPAPPIANQSFPPGWVPPPPIVHQPPPPWNNSYIWPTRMHQESSGFVENRPRHHIPPRSPNNLPHISKDVPIPQKSQEESDNEWIKHFVQRCNGEKSTYTEDQVVKLSEARQLHLKAYKLLKVLQDGSQSDSDAKLSLNSSAKKELDKILQILNDDEYILKIAALARKRKRKRTRSKIRRQEDFNRKAEMQDLIKERHIVVDKWLEDRKKVEDDLKRERKVRKDLDEYLSGVRLKQQNAQRHLNVFNAIAKLRKARYESAVRKGLSPPSDTHNEVFRATHHSACKRLREFIAECKTEESFMRKYLTEEHEAEVRRIQEKLKEEKEKKIRDWKDERSKVLFGSEDDLGPSDPIWPVHEIHCQGMRSLAGLVNVRAQWDSYISDAGSRIPTHWVEPPMPSCDEWQGYMANS